MTNKKKNTQDPEIVKAAESAPATKSKTEKSKPASTAAVSKSSAATHKATARKPAVRKTVAAAATASPAPVSSPAAEAKPAFDAAACQHEIATEAYYQWMNRGGGEGREQEDWLRAVEVVRARYE
ncbi:DUF2934 domain-containing protein [uncultured Paludibaculum sp.]|uniref:DUF2934 domain-containing protein n=1 Tax=uncultured Paludibaculum sp. TaxID=1765020 RepID=UPI002AAB6249|nr:DUF2934 domain-containing protein [uncultured Paludibaculum sp.]